MAFAVRAGAALLRSRVSIGGTADSPSIVPWALQFNDAGPVEPRRFPEIDCLRATMAPDVLAAAEDRAAALGVGADRVLITAGALSDETYLRALSERLGVAFEPLDGVPRALCPISDERLIESAAAGLLPLAVGNDLYLVVAPRAGAARRISGMIEDNPDLARRFRFTSAERLTRFVTHWAGPTLAARASDHLKRTWPALSAAPPRRLGNIVPVAITGMVGLAAFVLATAATLYAVEIVLAAVFLAWLALRVAGAFVGYGWRDSSGNLPDDALPVYTVIAALYREAASVDGLLSADYPPEKLDVVVAVEADDGETRTAIAARKCRIPLTVIPVPALGPRTKPKALNAALPFARGAFTVIYDAEDRPEADQLRGALRAFRAGGKRLASVQARLCINDTAFSWLTRLFTAEYAGQFDVFLLGIAALGLPLPLGGHTIQIMLIPTAQFGGVLQTYQGF
jgi:hypothetical protein